MKKVDRVINVIFAFGAAIVIYGALLKILHKPGADLFLQIGLYAEVSIFCIMGIQEIFKKPEQNNAIIQTPSVGSNWELTESINSLNQTLKKVFNQ